MDPQFPSPFTDAEYARRFQQVREVLQANEVPAVVLYGNRGAAGLIPYLSNFNPRWDAFLVVPVEGDPTLLVQLYNHTPNARRVSRLSDTRWGGGDSVETLARELQSRGLAQGALGLSGPLSYQLYGRLQRALPEVGWKDLSQAMVRLRWVKSDEEINLMRRAAELTDLAVKALVEGVRPGLTDKELPALMEAAVAPLGGKIDLCYLASTPMGAPSICVPAQNYANRKIEKGDVIITEIGIGWKGYAGQMHRPIAVGEAPTAEYRRLYEVAQEAYQRIVRAIKPGASGEDVWDAADCIAESGFSIYDDLVHGFGGGYLAPVLRTRQTAHGKLEPFVFEKNMCVVVQPNVISPDERMGVQLGNLHVVTETGLESLHCYPLEFAISSPM